MYDNWVITVSHLASMRPSLSFPAARNCLLVCGLLSLCALHAFPQDNHGDNAPAVDSETAFRLKASTNLVVLRVVVRGTDGKPVAGLKKEDFRVFDRGKEQSISQFDVEASSLPPNPTVATKSTPATGGSKIMAASQTDRPGNFIALYFDDLNTSDSDLIYARDAADKFLSANSRAEDRTAIFTSADMLADFTSDLEQIRAALAKLKASAHAMTRVHNCPDLSDYQAQEINQQNPDFSEAWQMALDEAVKRCKLLAVDDRSDASMQQDSPSAEKAQTGTAGVPNADNQLVNMIRMMARKVVFQTEMQARANFSQLDRLVDYVAKMPGRKTIILVSPGFLANDEQDELDRIVDHAIREQVVISALDPRGLAPPKESDASRAYISGRPGSAERLNSQREIAASDVLSQVAQDTGGEYFRNNNDLKSGFSTLSGAPVYYMLAFVPSNLKADGKFHPLKVELAQKQKGFDLQARRGYFAPKNKGEAEKEANRQAELNSETQTEQQIREAIASKTDTRQFPVTLNGKLSEGLNGIRDLSLIAHVDTKPLHFQKDGKLNSNTLTFAFAIFDEKETLITSQEKGVKVGVTDTQLADLLRDGINMSMDFHLKPGTYRIREVVMDSEEHHLTAISTRISVP